MEQPRKPKEPLARPPDSDHPTPTEPAAGEAGELQKILGCLASPKRLAVVASLAHGPRSGEQIAAALNMGTAEVDEHLRNLASCGLVDAAPDRRSYSLAPQVEVHEALGDLHINLRTPDGAKVQAQLPLDTPTGRILARGWRS